jgi:hypothetical protein
MPEHLLRTVERTPDGFAVRHDHKLTIGESVTVGREADLPLASDPADTRVSRQAVTLTPTERGWSVTITNKNGILVQPWGLPAWRARPEELLTDTHVGLRVLGEPAREHWILLQTTWSPTEDLTNAPDPVTLSTIRSVAVRPITTPQLEAVVLLFDEVLAWPPRPSAAPGQLKQVARQLGLSVSAVQERLKPVIARAVALGLSRDVEVTDPEYVHVLLRAGYLTVDQVEAVRTALSGT